jgi:hypothetical protein
MGHSRIFQNDCGAAWNDSNHDNLLHDCSGRSWTWSTKLKDRKKLALYMAQQEIGMGRGWAGCGVENEEGAWGCLDGALWDTGDEIWGWQEGNRYINEQNTWGNINGTTEEVGTVLGGEGWMRFDVKESHSCGILPMGWKGRAHHRDGVVMWKIDAYSLKGWMGKFIFKLLNSKYLDTKI